jgi:hypothetical protein
MPDRPPYGAAGSPRLEPSDSLAAARDRELDDLVGPEPRDRDLWEGTADLSARARVRATTGRSDYVLLNLVCEGCGYAGMVYMGPPRPPEELDRLCPRCKRARGIPTGDRPRRGRRP